jgi:hypothetical protein
MSIIQYSSKPYDIFTIDDVFSDNQLEEWLSYIKNTDFSNTRPFTTSSDFYNGKVIYPEWSKIMYDKIEPYLPSFLKYGNIHYIMFSHIETGKHFGIHTDTGAEYNIKKNIKSGYTVLIYLNDDFEGGTTEFFTDGFISNAIITPKKGRVLIFNIDLYHRGNEVLKGDKYWIGTEFLVPIN